MRRKLFFWLEKLKITPEERITIAGLMAVLVILNLLNLWIEPTAATDSAQYEAIQEKFEQRSAKVALREAKIMSRYNPKSPGEQTASLAPANPSQDTTEQDSTTKERAPTPRKINVNSATREELDSLPGIGPVYAQRIIAYRDSTDGFNTVDELIKIKGIGDKRLEDIRPRVEI